MKVKANRVVRYNGTSFPPGEEFTMTAEDFEIVPAGILEVTEEDAPKEDTLKTGVDVDPPVDFDKLKVDELKAMASQAGIEGFTDMKKSELVEALTQLTPAADDKK